MFFLDSMNQHIKNCPCNKCLDWDLPTESVWTSGFRIVEMENDDYVLQMLSPHLMGWVEIYRNDDVEIVRKQRAKVDPTYLHSHNKIKRVVE